MSNKPKIQAPSARQVEQPANVTAYTAKAGAGGYDKLRGQAIRISGPVPIMGISSDLEGPAIPAARITATLGFAGTDTESVAGPRIERIGKGAFLSGFSLLASSPTTWYDSNRAPVPSWEKEANQVGPDLGDRFRISAEGFGLISSVGIDVGLSTPVAPAEVRFRLIRDSDLVIMGQTPVLEVSVNNSPVLFSWNFHNLILTPNTWYRWEFERTDAGSSNITFEDLCFHFDGVP